MTSLPTLNLYQSVRGVSGHREVESCRILSLFELMFEYAIDELVMAFSAMFAVSEILRTRKEPLEPIETGPIDAQRLQSLCKILNGLYYLGKEMGLDSSLMAQIDKLYGDLRREKCDLPTITIRTRINSIIEGIQENLSSRKFMFLPADQASYWGNQTVFGTDFMSNFPLAAKFEALEAANCFAAGRWTACVFHCTRVAEYGLRKLAQRLKVTLSDKGKRQPLEYGDWNKVIAAIRRKIEESRKLPLGRNKADSLSRYSDLADRCEYMKDIWRNEVSHARRVYSKSECLGVIDRVRGFIESIPTKPKIKPTGVGVS